MLDLYGSEDLPGVLETSNKRKKSSAHNQAYRQQVIDGANHFSLAYPVDESTGRHFLDETEEGDGARIRELLAELFVRFVRDVTGGPGGEVASLEDHELIRTLRRR